MESNASEVGRSAAVTRALLRCGVLAGPFYLAVGLIQALLRDGFDLARHPLSLLANGPAGWVQTANFVLTGLMVVAAAVGFGRVPGPKSRAVTWFLGAFGAAMIVAALFPADPMDGFPPGTPQGPPTAISTTGLVHFVAGALGFTSLAISCFFAAGAMSRRNASALARLSLLQRSCRRAGLLRGHGVPNGNPGNLVRSARGVGMARRHVAPSAPLGGDRLIRWSKVADDSRPRCGPGRFARWNTGVVARAASGDPGSTWDDELLDRKRKRSRCGIRHRDGDEASPARRRRRGQLRREATEQARIRAGWRGVNGVPRSVSLRSLAAGLKSGQASLKACGVRPVHRRKDRWNAAGSEYCRKNAMSPMLRLGS